MASIETCHNVADLRDEAKRRLPKWVFEFIDRGSEDEWAPEHQREAFKRIKLRSRALTDMSGRTLKTSLFGKELSVPWAIAPTGVVGLCWYNGEYELAKAAAKAGIPFSLATASVTPLEKVAEAGGNLWFQLYLWEKRELSHALIRRAHRAGYETLVVTADFGLGTNREYNRRNGFNMPFKPNYRVIRDMLQRPGWLYRVLLPYLRTTGMPKQANYPAEVKLENAQSLRTESITWDDISRLRDIWQGKMLIKGILRADDAIKAVEAGADGIVVSSHGGRNLDSAVAPIDALPAIVEAVGDRTTLILDSGIRRGSDIVKALALGANAVLIGRATIWGTAIAGQRGAEHALALLKNEYEKTLGFVGCRNVGELTRDILASDQSLRGHTL